jgi:hypothetical protein
MTYLLNFIKIYKLVQKFIVGHTHKHAVREQVHNERKRLIDLIAYKTVMWCGKRGLKLYEFSEHQERDQVKSEITTGTSVQAHYFCCCQSYCPGFHAVTFHNRKNSRRNLTSVACENMPIDFQAAPLI